MGGFTGLLLGSVAVHLAAHAACPLLVIRGATERQRPVLLGVDGSPANEPAVGFAFEEAVLRGVPLRAVHTYTHPVSRAAGLLLGSVSHVVLHHATCPVVVVPHVVR